ncbi:MAG: hypothetical protein AB7I27_18700 [Bacteriovoracaceae bacterium]
MNKKIFSTVAIISIISLILLFQNFNYTDEAIPAEANLKIPDYKSCFDQSLPSTKIEKATLSPSLTNSSELKIALDSLFSGRIQILEFTPGDYSVLERDSSGLITGIINTSNFNRVNQKHKIQLVSKGSEDSLSRVRFTGALPPLKWETVPHHQKFGEDGIPIPKGVTIYRTDLSKVINFKVLDPYQLVKLEGIIPINTNTPTASEERLVPMSPGDWDAFLAPNAYISGRTEHDILTPIPLNKNNKYLIQSEDGSLQEGTYEERFRWSTGSVYIGPGLIFDPKQCKEKESCYLYARIDPTTIHIKRKQTLSKSPNDITVFTHLPMEWRGIKDVEFNNIDFYAISLWDMSGSSNVEFINNRFIMSRGIQLGYGKNASRNIRFRKSSFSHLIPKSIFYSDMKIARFRCDESSSGEQVCTAIENLNSTQPGVAAGITDNSTSVRMGDGSECIAIEDSRFENVYNGIWIAGDKDPNSKYSRNIFIKNNNIIGARNDGIRFSNTTEIELTGNIITDSQLGIVTMPISENSLNNPTELNNISIYIAGNILDYNRTDMRTASHRWIWARRANSNENAINPAVFGSTNSGVACIHVKNPICPPIQFINNTVVHRGISDSLPVYKTDPMDLPIKGSNIDEEIKKHRAVFSVREVVPMPWNQSWNGDRIFANLFIQMDSDQPLVSNGVMTANEGNFISDNNVYIRYSPKKSATFYRNMQLGKTFVYQHSKKNCSELSAETKHSFPKELRDFYAGRRKTNLDTDSIQQLYGTLNCSDTEKFSTTYFGRDATNYNYSIDSKSIIIDIPTKKMMLLGNSTLPQYEDYRPRISAQTLGKTIIQSNVLKKYFLKRPGACPPFSSTEDRCQILPPMN